MNVEYWPFFIQITEIPFKKLAIPNINHIVLPLPLKSKVDNELCIKIPKTTDKARVLLEHFRGDRGSENLTETNRKTKVST